MQYYCKEITVKFFLKIQDLVQMLNKKREEVI